MDPLNLYLGFTNVCRLCLSQDRPLIKIFTESVEEKGELFSISSKILACAGIQVLAEDNLPDKICEMCLKEVDHWTEFKQICDNANTLLLQCVAGLSPLQNQVLRNNLRGCNEENIENLITPSVFDERLALEAESFFQKIDEKNLPSLLSADSLSSEFIDNDNVDVKETITLYSGEADSSEVPAWTCNKKVIKVNELELTSGMEFELREGFIAKEPEVGMEDIMVVTQPDRPEIDVDNIIVGLEEPSQLYEHFNPPKGANSLDDEVDVLRESDNNLDNFGKQVKNLSSNLFVCDMAEENESEGRNELNGQQTDEFDDIKLPEELSFPEGKSVNELFEDTKENREEISESTLEAQRQKYREKYHKQYKKKYDCGICPRVFSRFSHLLRHDKIEHALVKAQYKCQYCNQKFISEGRLQFHSSMRHGENIFLCVHCDFYSVSKKSLSMHIKHIHLKEYSLAPCHICGKFYRSKSNLLNHIKLHARPKFPCNTCGKEFTQSQALNRHFNTNHTFEFFECDICLKQFKSWSYMQKHKKYSHTTNSLVCDVCGGYYKNEITLNIHKMCHQEKVHSCNVCSKSFTTITLLNRHMNMHVKTREYMCEVCDKVFTRHDTLKVHLRVMHGSEQNTFMCEICNEVFALKKYLSAHTKNMHTKITS